MCSCFSLLNIFFFSYSSCSLVKYMDRHKIKPDSKAFHLVSCVSFFLSSFGCQRPKLLIFSAAKTAAYGSDQEDNLRAGHAGFLFQRRTDANRRVSPLLWSSILFSFLGSHFLRSNRNYCVAASLPAVQSHTQRESS